MLGIEIGSTGIAVAHVTHPEQGRPVLQSCRFLPGDESDPPPLAAYIDEMGLKNSLCNVVLASNSYSLILTEAPTVEDDELADAMRWKMDELIDFPIEEAVLDVFRIPDDSSQGITQMVYVTVTRRSLIEDTVALLKSSKLQVQSIDIVELALRNLSLLLMDKSFNNDQTAATQDSAGLTIVLLSPGAGNLNILKGQQLYLSRRFELDWEGGLLDQLPANALALELQRSLDYFEHQMNQKAPTRIFLCGTGVSDDKLIGESRSNLFSELKVLPLGDLLELPEGCEELSITNCIGAIGGALRESDSA